MTKYKIVGTYFLTKLDPHKCAHPHIETWTTGGMHYEDGEVWDDYEDHTVCQLCGAELAAIEPARVPEYSLIGG